MDGCALADCKVKVLKLHSVGIYIHGDISYIFDPQ